MTNRSGPTFVITAIELLLVLVIAFLVPGTLSPIAASPTPNAQQEQAAASRAEEDARRRTALQAEAETLAKEVSELSAGLPAARARGVAPVEIERLRKALAATRERDERVAEARTAMGAEIERLQRELVVFSGRENELRELDGTLAARARDVAALRAARDAQRVRLAELQAALAAAGKEKYGFASGAPLTRPERTAGRLYGVVLSGGRVIPIAQPYYTGQRNADGSTTGSPARPGLTLEEALRADSPLMREVMSPAFRQNGQVNMLVAADSFPTYRALRDVLIREGVDYGWDPIESTVLRFSSGGRAIPSQGPRP